MFFIRAMGCDYHHGTDFFIRREHGYDCYLALFLKSRSILSENGETIHCEPNTFIIFNVGSEHIYGADGEEYIEDWIQFECDSNFMSRLNLPFDRPVHIDERIELDRYFALIRSVFFRCINDDIITDDLMTAMLTEVSVLVNRRSGDMPYYKELLALRRKIHASPELDWSVKMMAEELHISPAYIQELYKKTFGISCMNDVIECRISCAKNLLTGSRLSIREIAEKCGYNSNIHFSRQFRANTGMSPSEWSASRQPPR